MSDDTPYYRQRAIVERSRAEQASAPEVALIHERLAERYEALAAQLNQSAEDGASVFGKAELTGSGKEGASDAVSETSLGALSQRFGTNAELYASVRAKTARVLGFRTEAEQWDDVQAQLGDGKKA